MLVGYARVSTPDQDPKTQISALKEAGCQRVYFEKASGAKWERRELMRLLDDLSEGDILVVWKLDRLSRSLKDLLFLIERIEKAGAGFRSLTESIDTTSPGGRLMVHIIGTFAEFERSVLRERTINGMIQACKEGRKGGRPRALTPLQEQEITRAIKEGKIIASKAARLFNVSPATICRLMQKEREKPQIEEIEEEIEEKLRLLDQLRKEKRRRLNKLRPISDCA